MSNLRISKSRRNFLQASVAGAAGLAIAGPFVKKAKGATFDCTVINLSTTQINQEIDNLRVAYIQDAPAGTVTSTSMVRSSTSPTPNSFAAFNNTTTGIRYDAVYTNMDKLACALSNKTNVTDAWNTIFKIPSSKTWPTAKVAIKVNAFAGFHPCVPIVAKIVQVLVDKGVQPSNIIIFDGQVNPNGFYGTADFMGAGKPLPSGIVFQNGLSDTVKFPDGTSWGASPALNGADIVVNIAVNKGHDRYDQFSGVTMCLKNHFATIAFGHADSNAAEGIVKMCKANACSHLIGNIPANYPAKQQLCIVDSTWLGNAGDWSGGTSAGNNANAIVMGTFAGAVDYVATNYIRKPKLSGGINTAIVDKFLTQFGYPASANTTVMTKTTGPGAGLVDASAVTVLQKNEIGYNLAKNGYVRFSITGNGIKFNGTNIYLGKNESIKFAEIYDMIGRKVKTLYPVSKNLITWDAKTENGSIAKNGNYILKIYTDKIVSSQSFILAR